MYYFVILTNLPKKCRPLVLHSSAFTDIILIVSLYLAISCSRTYRRFFHDKRLLGKAVELEIGRENLKRENLLSY